MIFTNRFKFILGFVAVIFYLAAYALLAYNQFTLQKELGNQQQFDLKVMNTDQKVWTEVSKVASEAATRLSPTPTPRLLVK